MTTVTISLPESLKAFIDHQLATKGYGNVSEYFRSLLREAQKEEEDARLETLLLEGLAGGGRRHSGDAGVLEGPQSGSAHHRREAQGAEAAVKLSLIHI